MQGLADAIAEDRGGPLPAGGLPYIRDHLQWCGQNLAWFGDLAADLGELHHEARALVRDQPQEPLGDCLGVAQHAERVGWDYYGEMFIPSDGSDREAEMKRQACEVLGVPMPGPVYRGWKL